MNLLETLRQIKDPRRKQGQRFALDKILLMIIMAMMRGCFQYREIARFCQYHQSELTRLLKLKSKHMPSHVTIRQILLNIDYTSLQESFHLWTTQYVCIEKQQWISVDAKVIKSTVSDSFSHYQDFVSLVSMFSQKREQIIAAEKFHNKQSSETTVLEHLLESLDLKEVVFTMDAFYCKKNTSPNSQHS